MDRILRSLGRIHLNGVNLDLLEVADDDVTDDVEAALLERVDEVDEGAAASRVLDQEEHLRTPELDVGLARVQEEQVLAHLQWTKSSSVKFFLSMILS